MWTDLKFQFHRYRFFNRSVSLIINKLQNRFYRKCLECEFNGTLMICSIKKILFTCTIFNSSGLTAISKSSREYISVFRFNIYASSTNKKESLGINWSSLHKKVAMPTRGKVCCNEESSIYLMGVHRSRLLVSPISTFRSQLTLLYIR